VTGTRRRRPFADHYGDRIANGGLIANPRAYASLAVSNLTPYADPVRPEPPSPPSCQCVHGNAEDMRHSALCNHTFQ
jgi:hypothetical protein